MSDPEYAHVGSIYVRIAEEAGEVVQAAMKCERFGPTNEHPDEPHETNYMALVREFEDLRRIIEIDLPKTRMDSDGP